jgi:hypothetical protein
VLSVLVLQLPAYLQVTPHAIFFCEKFGLEERIQERGEVGTNGTISDKKRAALAADTEGSGVDFFCVSPGLVKTEMTRGASMFDDLPASAWSPPEAIAGVVGRLWKEDFTCLSGRFLHVSDDLDALKAEAAKIKEAGLYKIAMSTLDGTLLS